MGWRMWAGLQQEAQTAPRSPVVMTSLFSLAVSHKKLLFSAVFLVTGKICWQQVPILCLSLLKHRQERSDCTQHHVSSWAVGGKEDIIFPRQHGAVGVRNKRLGGLFAPVVFPGCQGQAVQGHQADMEPPALLSAVWSPGYQAVEQESTDTSSPPAFL